METMCVHVCFMLFLLFVNDKGGEHSVLLCYIYLCVMAMDIDICVLWQWIYDTYFLAFVICQCREHLTLCRGEQEHLTLCRGE